jgi:ferrous iron transport protein A
MWTFVESELHYRLVGGGTGAAKPKAARQRGAPKNTMDALSGSLATFPLLLAGEGERVRIVAYRSGREMERKLADLGLTVGSEVTVLSRHGHGPLVVARDHVRIAIGAGIAHRVLVARPAVP